VFQPAGLPATDLSEVVLNLDEFEAIRLVDLLGQYQDEAAARMNVSRPTAGRVLERARRKIADALVHGKILRIEGGCVERSPESAAACPRCRLPGPGVPGPGQECPRCRRHGRMGDPPKHIKETSS
jgi:predicted DNA-binding protein (UPF0251 family)